MPEQDFTAPIDVWINARFLGRRVTGVERVAYELINAMADGLLDESGTWSDGLRTFRFRLIAPRSFRGPSPWGNLELVRAGRLRGHAWEQIDLPRLTRGKWLLSLCNTGPALKRQHVVFLHDAQTFAVPDNFSWRFRTWYRQLFRLLGRNAARVLVNSRFTSEELAQHAGIDPARMDVCHLGIEHIGRLAEAPDIVARHGLGDEPFVLAVSSANPNKNFEAVVRALELLGDDAPPCVIVGMRSQGHFGDVQLDPEKTRHLGYVDDNELLALYRRALCMVFPSFYEGFGLPPLEAMAAGCPVIVSNTSSMPEVAGPAAHYCNPHDPASLAHGIRLLKSYPRKREALRSAGLQRARQFSWASGGRVVLDAVAHANRAMSARDAINRFVSERSGKPAHQPR